MEVRVCVDAGWITVGGGHGEVRPRSAQCDLAIWRQVIVSLNQDYG